MLPNIIIVEGIDRVGKTTLVNKIVEEYGYKIFKAELPELINGYDEIIKMKAILSILKLLENDKIIFDRFHFTEYVYGALERDYLNLDVISIDQELAKLNSLFIYMKPTDINKSSEEHGSDLTKHDVLFDALYLMSDIEKMKCNYNSMDKIIKYLDTLGGK